MSDELKTIDFGNFKLDVTEDQFEKIGEMVHIDEDDGDYKVYDPVIDLGEYIDETLIWVMSGGIMNQTNYFQNGDGTYYEFEFSKPTDGDEFLDNFDFYNKSKWVGLFLKDNSTGNFLKPSESPDFDSFDDFNGNYQMNSSEIYLLRDFDIKSHLDI